VPDTLSKKIEGVVQERDSLLKKVEEASLERDKAVQNLGRLRQNLLDMVHIFCLKLSRLGLFRTGLYLLVVTYP
jgi:hypothetical protein